MACLLQHLVDESARRYPDQPAFVVPGDGLTYAELAEQSNRLANLLIESGVRPGDRVGIHLPRGLMAPLAVYGILKAGAAFVPLDPHAPAAATERLVECCGIRHVICDPSRGADALEKGMPHRLIDAFIGPSEAPGSSRAVPWAAIDGSPQSPPGIRRTDLDPAYIMFSSGSTGRPKGIVHTHRSGMAYARASAETYGLGPEDQVGSHSPLHFDMSTLGYFSAPFAAASTVIIPEAYTKVAASLSTLIERERVTVWYSVPLALIQLLQRGAIERCDHTAVRWVLYGGEPFPVKHLRALMRAWPGARFSNVYGPAEVNQCTYYHLPTLADQDEHDTSPVPIGRVWPDAEGLVVDDQDRLVQPGEAGELLIRSSTMMHGYWNRPDLNAKAFYRRPNASGGEDVFYRTGDLVREREDGNLDFLGRRDRQLKVRGYRVELDEVEHALAGLPGVHEAAVFKAREVEGGAIGAVVTAAGNSPLDPEQLRQRLSDLLSWYAVPQYIRVISSMPMTATGKIDRRALERQAERGFVEVNETV